MQTKERHDRRERKETSLRTRVRMDFDPKTSKLHNQKKVEKYLAKYGFRLNPRIKIEFYPYGVDISKAPPNDGVYMNPQVLALGLKLPMMRFVRSVLTFYTVASSQLSAKAWRTVLRFKALCALFALKVCQREVFSTTYTLRRTLQDAHYFVP